MPDDREHQGGAPKSNSAIGLVSGLLTVIGIAVSDSRGRKKVLARCVCGNEKIIQLYSIKSGNTKSCGCERIAATKRANSTHGLSKHPLHKVWEAMKRRCSSASDKSFKHYGGRGISVCAEWRNNYMAFHEFALSNGYVHGLEIDRKDNDGNYEPSNVRFVTPRQNCRNRRLLISSNKTGYCGAVNSKGGFKAQVKYGSIHYVKCGFATAIEAAKHRDMYCITHGLALPLNFPGLRKEAAA